MERVYFTTEDEGSINSIDMIDGTLDCANILDVKNRILELSNRDRIDGSRWRLLRCEGRIELGPLTTIESILSMTPIPGTIGSPFILVGPSSKRHRSYFSLPCNAEEVVVNDSLIVVPHKLRTLLYSKSCTSESGDLYLYKRESLISQIKFLEDNVLRDDKRGWVLGPPGTGKSAAAFAFARLKASEGWTVSWISFFDSAPLYCIRFENDQFSKCHISKSTDIIDILETENKHVVFIDGFRSGNLVGDQLIADCTSWWSSSHSSPRRLAIISSMAARKSRAHGPEGPAEAEFYEDSWLETELIAACRIPELLEAVSNYLDASTHLNMEDRIAAKFFYAGGSARYMFTKTTEEVKSIIEAALPESRNLVDYITSAIPDRNNNTINRILGSYRSSSGRRFPFVVSKYASIQLAIWAGPEGVRSMKVNMRAQKNPAIDGWIFEMLFFAKLNTEGLKMSTADGHQLTWQKAEAPYIKDIPALKSFFQGAEATWIKPERWNQPGFDAIMIKPIERVIEFFQITQGATHTLRLNHFADSLSNLDPSLNFDIFVYVVIPLSKFNTFKLGPVSGDRELQRMRNGWSTAERVQIIGMDDS